MKKHFLEILAMALLAVAVCAITVFSSSSNTVVTLSYLDGTYTDQLTNTLSQLLSPLDTAYQAALEKSGQTSTTGGWTSSDSFRLLYPQSGETVTISSGSGLMWFSGSGGVTTGALIDATTGTELSVGESLTVGHHYLTETETMVTASSAVTCGAEGLWKTTATGSPPPFSDVDPVQDWWFYDSVVYVTEHGLFNGIGGGLFDPLGTMDRSMMVTVLYRMAGEPSISMANPFVDVEDGQWYTDAVIWASQAGVAKGTSANTFSPNAPVTREQMAAMFHSFAAWCGYDVSDRVDVTGFADSGEIHDYGLAGLQWAVAVGLFQGSETNMLMPRQSACRRDVAVLLQRFDQMTF